MPIQLGDEAPLIVTALIGADSFAILDGLRRRHFPEALNRVPAHVSLFHHLPGDAVARIVGTVAALCRDRGDSFDLAPAGLRFLGRGVAIMYEAGPLAPLHASLAREWRDWLTPQDRQPFKAHVTIQNKATPDTARSLHAAMQGDALPACRIEGLVVWRYLSGPWERVATCPFGSGML